MINDFGIQFVPAAAALTGQGRDGNPPMALAGEAPIRAVGDHAPYPFFAGLGDPLHVAFDHVVELAAQSVMIDLQEPLFRGPEYDRRLAPPAMRVGMPHIFRSKQYTLSIQVLDDPVICFKNMLPGVPAAACV